MGKTKLGTLCIGCEHKWHVAGACGDFDHSQPDGVRGCGCAMTEETAERGWPCLAREGQAGCLFTEGHKGAHVYALKAVLPRERFKLNSQARSMVDHLVSDADGLTEGVATLMIGLLGPKPKVGHVIAFGIGTFAGAVLASGLRTQLPRGGESWKCRANAGHLFTSALGDKAKLCPICGAKVDPHEASL